MSAIRSIQFSFVWALVIGFVVLGNPAVCLAAGDFSASSSGNRSSGEVLNSGIRALGMGDYQGAADCFREYLDMTKGSSLDPVIEVRQGVRYRLAQLLYDDLDDKEQAVVVLEAYIDGKFAYQTLNAYRMLVDCYFELERYEECVDAVNAALEYNEKIQGQSTIPGRSVIPQSDGSAEYEEDKPYSKAEIQALKSKKEKSRIELGEIEDPEKKAKEEEAKYREMIPYSFNDVSENLVIIECKTSIGTMVGSGFVAEMDGKVYIFTNQHVIMGAESIEFKTVTGKKLKPRGVELSKERDIARLPLAEWDEPLQFTETIDASGAVAVFGNSEGSGVATELYGKVNGIGPELVEVSAQFVSGNSGSPVLNEEMKVIGIASYVKYSDTNRMKEGTKFENAVRRFCYRLDGVDWAPVNWRVYNEKYGKPYLSAQGTIDVVFAIINGWYDDPFGRVPTDNLPDSSMNSWARNHNEMADRVGKIVQKNGGSRSQLAKVRDEIKQSAHSLSVITHRLSLEMGKQSEDPSLTEFLRTEFEGYTEALDFTSAVIDQVGEEISKYIDNKI